MIKHMFDADPRVQTALGHLAAARQELAGLDLATPSGDQLLELMAALEIDVRQRASVQHAVVAELDARGVAAELGCASTAVLLCERLHLGRREAAGRVRLAAELGPRRAMSGQRLPARFPQVAGAVAQGAISGRHAALICRTIDDLPEAAVEQAGAVEAMLVEHARTLNPDQLAVLTRTVRACLDPDGALGSERDHERRRHATLTALPDGSGRLQAKYPFAFDIKDLVPDLVPSRFVSAVAAGERCADLEIAQWSLPRSCADKFSGLSVLVDRDCSYRKRGHATHRCRQGS